MKNAFALLLSTTILSQAALIPIGVSPAGSSAAVGLSPSNEVPPLTGNASGGPIGPGVTFDSVSNLLHLALGYGSAAGFTDLTGPAIDAGIFGPAATNENAPMIVDIFNLNFSAQDPGTGGLIFGDVSFATNEVPGLLSGLDYINIATTNNPGGEIRGQLVPLDLPPLLTCPEAITSSCSSPVTLNVMVGDQVGNSLDVVWSLNALPVQTNTVPAMNPPAVTNVEFTATLPIGTNLIEVTATSAIGSISSCSNLVTIVDTNPPVIVSASASPCTLWPPNHKMVKVTISAKVTDDCSATKWKIIGVTSNEPVNGKGDGNTWPDWKILNNHHVDLRAERSGIGNGRIYTITIQATDAAGNVSATKDVTVTVPKSHGRDNDEDNNKGHCSNQSKGHDRK